MGDLLASLGSGVSGTSSTASAQVEHPVGISWEYPKIRRHKAEEEEAEAKRFGKLEMLHIPEDRVGRESRKCVQYR